MTAYRVALGFDFGHARIGIAVGEAVTGAARPLCIVSSHQQRPDWGTIGRLIAEWQPDVLVIGVPRHADETASAVTEAALAFGGELHQRFHRPVVTIDERLSSWEAEQRYIASIPTGRRHRSIRLDAQAAAVILESWFRQQKSENACVTPNF